MRQIRIAMEFIAEQRAQGRNVYIHCKGGHGRSAAIAFCWLLHNRKMSLAQAQQHLLSRRIVRSKLFEQPNMKLFYQEIQIKVTKENGVEETEITIEEKSRSDSAAALLEEIRES